MAKKPRRLKVFQAAFGFHESVVAAPSQVRALEIWGARQNLFAEGQAHVTADAAAVAAALKHPETPLRRAVGSNDPFVLDPADAAAPKVPRAPKKSAGASKTTAKRKPAKPRPADRSALSAAEAALRRLENDHEDERREFERRQAALDKEAAAARRRFGKARLAAERGLERARAAFIAAGGAISR